MKPRTRASEPGQPGAAEKSGAEATAVQTLRAVRMSFDFREASGRRRLTAAFVDCAGSKIIIG